MADGPADPDNLRALAELPDALEQEVLAALELEADKRDAALTDIAASNPQHAGLLRAWVAAAMADDAPPSQPPARVPPADAPPPSAIGPYRLLHVLGRGGFGTVWLAEQDQPIRRQVAIKVVNPGMDSREVLARFHGEREALNRMDHPGIARLIDAGATSDGQPYFVMEYVPGVMLRTHCRSASIDVTQRLQLFLCVLDAVQHAHMKAVIHRDLSSNNVLVTEIDGRWQPKIIDFGVAKSLAVPLQESGGLTFHGTLMGTPEFMSPEQAKGLGDIDTRADVYALGVQLYELLTDQLPIPSTVLRAEGVAGMARVVSTFVPAVPSCIAPAPHRAALRGDLDLIVLRALAKDRNERYATAAELAADLRRYLAHQPVHAARPGRWYVLRKFARRNRLPFAAALLLAAGLLAALGVSLHFLHEAGQARIDAEQARQRSDARADAGFKLLANIDRLQAAEQRERELGPPWPDQLPAMRDWLSRLAEPLVKQLPAMEQKLAALQQQAPTDDPEDAAAAEHLLHALEYLVPKVRQFAAAGGPLASVRARLQFAEASARNQREHAEDWRRAFEALKASNDKATDGSAASTAYGGLQLPPQPGLLPLGCNPATLLWEFLDLASHQSEAPPPPRDPATGMLRTGPETGIVLVLLPAGEFWMGAHRDDPGLEQNDPLADDKEMPMHIVMLDAFFMARTELTREQWRRLGGEGDGLAERPDPDRPMLPVAQVSWSHADELLLRWGLALPSEAQWEYAARAGTHTQWCCVDQKPGPTCGWFGPEPRPVGRLPANAFGLFDVHGNVAEWCRDELLDYDKCHARPGDGLREGPAGKGRVVRGGSCLDAPAAARCGARLGMQPTTRSPVIGLRPARAIVR